MAALLLALAVAAAPAARERAAPAGTPGAAERQADPLERRRAAIADELVRLGARLQREIEAGDVEALLARVPESGLRCAGRVVPRARVARDLRTPGSWLNAVLIGTPGAPPGPPRSLRAFFGAAPEVAVLVSFRRDARAGALGLPCLEYRARDVAPPRVTLCFEARAGRWWFTESLYPCG